MGRCTGTRRDEIKELTKDLAAMIESATEIGLNNWLGRNTRNRLEKWIGEIINKFRNDKMNPPENSSSEKNIEVKIRNAEIPL